jgi:hypothetical protein
MAGSLAALLASKTCCKIGSAVSKALSKYESTAAQVISLMRTPAKAGKARYDTSMFMEVYND